MFNDHLSLQLYKKFVYTSGDTTARDHYLVRISI